jgi:hypothetical protein
MWPILVSLGWWVNGWSDPRFRLRPVRLGSETLTRTFRVSMADETSFFAKGSRGRRDTPITGSSNCFSGFAVLSPTWCSRICECLSAIGFFLVLIGISTYVLQLRLATKRFDAIIECFHYTWMLYAYDTFWGYGIGRGNGSFWSSVGARHCGSALLLLQFLSMRRHYLLFNRLKRCQQPCNPCE